MTTTSRWIASARRPVQNCQSCLKPQGVRYVCTKEIEIVAQGLTGRRVGAGSYTGDSRRRLWQTKSRLSRELR